MPSVNKVYLLGFVGDEPRIYDNGVPGDGQRKVASISLATTEKGYTRRDGTKVDDRTEWHDVVTFGKLAQVAETYIHKGTLLFVEGKLANTSYEDKEGIKRYKTKIIADSFQMLGGNSRQERTETHRTETFPPPEVYSTAKGDLPF